MTDVVFPDASANEYAYNYLGQVVGLTNHNNRLAARDVLFKVAPYKIGAHPRQYWSAVMSFTFQALF